MDLAKSWCHILPGIGAAKQEAKGIVGICPKFNVIVKNGRGNVPTLIPSCFNYLGEIILSFLIAPSTS